MVKKDPREVGAGWVSVVAGLIHAYAGPEHFSEWWGYGLFFFAAALSQGIFGLMLLTHGLDSPARPWLTVRKQVYVAGIVGNLLILGLWLVTRTIGVPAGPEAGEVEAIGILDTASKVAELVVVALLAWIVARPAVPHKPV